MENQPDSKKEENCSSEGSVKQPDSTVLSEGPRYGAIASQNTRWIYGDKEHQGGDPQAYVAEQRRLEAEKKALENVEAEKAAERVKAANAGANGFFSGADFTAERKPRRWRSENPFHDASTPNLPNSNFGAADMSGQTCGFRVDPRYGGGKLPSRKAPITMFIVGLLLIFIISPALFFGGIIGIFASTNLQQVTDKSELQVQVEKDTFTVVAAKRADLNKKLKCEARQNGEKLVDLVETAEQESSRDELFVYRSITKGKLDIKCSSEDGKAPLELTVIVGMSFTIFVLLFVISTIFGVIGLILAIWGIIWWVRRNRLRRMALMGF